MKRILKNKGFALVETLMVSVATVALFGVLYSVIYPLSATAKATEKYEDLDTKYIAFYVKEFLETDASLGAIVGNGSITLNKAYRTYGLPCYTETIHNADGSYSTVCGIDASGSTHFYPDNNSYRKFIDSDSEIEAAFMGINSSSSYQSSTGNIYTYRNELCSILNNANDEVGTKNNQYFCNNYSYAAKITRMFIISYNTTSFYTAVMNNDTDTCPGGKCSRMLKEYVKTLPRHDRAVNANNRRLLIVEVQHDSYNTSGDFYYTYASIEVGNNPTT